MDALKIIVVILAIVLSPVIIGMLFSLIVGGPIYLAMKGFEYFMHFVINPFIAKIRSIPFIGVVLCFIVTTIIGLFLLVIVGVQIVIPVILIIIHTISAGQI